MLIPVFWITPEKLLLGSLCAVLGTALLTVCDALCVKGTTDDVITYTGEVTYTSASDQDHRVLLKVMTDTGDVGGSLHAVGQTNSCDLTKSGVRLLRAGGGNLGANASLLRGRLIGRRVGQGVKAVLEHRSLGLVALVMTTLSDELIKRWHSLFSSFFENIMFIQTQNPVIELCVAVDGMEIGALLRTNP